MLILFKVLVIEVSVLCKGDGGKVFHIKCLGLIENDVKLIIIKKLLVILWERCQMKVITATYWNQCCWDKGTCV